MTVNSDPSGCEITSVKLIGWFVAVLAADRVRIAVGKEEAL